MAEVSEGQRYKLEKNPTRKNGEWDTRKHRECADLKVGHYTWQRSGEDVEVLAHVAEFFVAGVNQFIGGMVGEGQELALEDFAEEFRGGFVIAVGASIGFGNNFVDDAKFHEVVGHNFHGDGGGFSFGRIAPDDGGAAFGRDHGVETVFENVDAITDGDSERSTRAAFTGDGDDNGNGETRHFAEIAGDGFPLAAFFGIDAGISAGSVDEGEHGTIIFCGELHDA